MSSPFEGADDTFVVLINEQGQHSLWPSFALVPAGWTQVFGEESRDACLSYVEQHWTDLRPQPPQQNAAAAAAGGVRG